MMKTYLLHQPGKPENLTLTETDIPTPAPHEVLVRVKAISINPVDVKARRNEGVLNWIFQDKRPVVLGWDISGVVEKTGAEVSGFQLGDEVFGMVNFIGSGNAYAEYVVAAAAHLAHKPSQVSFEDAAGATLAALTALQALELTKPAAGSTFLVNGASGGVGHYALQLGKIYGLRVTGTSSAANKAFVLAHGADAHFEYAGNEWNAHNNAFDFALDTASGEGLLRVIEAVKPGGKIITIPSGNINEKATQLAASKQIDLRFILVASSGNDMRTLAELMHSGKLRTHVHRRFAFEDLPAAHTCLEAGGVQGKVVVSLNGVSTV